MSGLVELLQSAFIDAPSSILSALLVRAADRIAELEERERAYIHDLSAKEAKLIEANARAGHTKTVEYDLSPVMTESALRDRLIELGWTPPKEDKP